MNGVLILAHGSRAKEAEQTVEKVVEMVRQQIDMPVEMAFMEFSERSIHAGMSALADRGVTHVKVVPYFLFSGMHIQEDIPGELDAFLREHPGMTVSMAQTIGADPRIADILVDRITQ